MFELTTDEISYDLYKHYVDDPLIGGVVVFEGKVRNHNDGRDVDSLEYEVYPEMALTEGKKIVDQGMKLYDIENAVCIHRHGHLQVGDVAVLVIAGAKHRKEAFLACEYIIDEVKLTVPVWKKEHYTNFPSKWVACHGCQGAHQKSLDRQAELKHSCNGHG